MERPQIAAESHKLMKLPRFGSRLAALLFGSGKAASAAPVPEAEHPDAGRLEERLADALCARLKDANRQEIHALCTFMEREVMPLLGGDSLLRVAEVIEANAPDAIESIPSLQRHQKHLQRAERMASIFERGNLQALTKAFEEEALRAQGR
ncbi:MAG: hypothetical protein E6Q67_00720 [Roseateles sp.]|nr:MAG: hypothetical protein E6Q67_00720 [Roseateles sp.]